ncbi:MAG TPA: NADP oxidoreductase [Sediminispirochaeta sp.]|nr:NADP oxidoreductase [Sediminispirochaeta sp.]
MADPAPTTIALQKIESFEEILALIQKALEMEPAEVYQEVLKSGLQGRGGAGFPTGLKEQATQQALCDSRGPKYVVCNADEGEPGTFKDRAIMETNPNLMVLGIFLSAYAIGAEKAYVYIRGEYGESIRRVRRSIEEFYSAGYLGRPWGSRGFHLDIEVKLGAGSYLCGEELTLLESLEGKRGYPRIKPPYPAEYGLFGAPTLINNVETFAHVPFVVEYGAEEYRKFGTPSSPGTKIFTVSGDVEKPAYYEREMGISLRRLIEESCGGMRKGGTFAAALLGGAAGTLVDSSVLDVPMTYQDLKDAGALLGSGAVVVLDQSRSISVMLHSILEFFRHESCGKCIPCRVGTAKLVRMSTAMAELPPGQRADMLRRMLTEAVYMDQTSLCPLGKSPLIPLRSVQRFFADRI